MTRRSPDGGLRAKHTRKSVSPIRSTSFWDELRYKRRNLPPSSISSNERHKSQRSRFSVELDKFSSLASEKKSLLQYFAFVDSFKKGLKSDRKFGTSNLLNNPRSKIEPLNIEVSDDKNHDSELFRENNNGLKADAYANELGSDISDDSDTLSRDSISPNIESFNASDYLHKLFAVEREKSSKRKSFDELLSEEISRNSKHDLSFESISDLNSPEPELDSPNNDQMRWLLEEKSRSAKNELTHNLKRSALDDNEEGLQSKRSKHSDQSETDDDMMNFYCEEIYGKKNDNSKIIEDIFEIARMPRRVLNILRSRSKDSTKSNSISENEVIDSQRSFESSKSFLRSDDLPLRNKRENRMCRFLHEGFCREGKNCKFSHDTNARFEKVPEICRYYQNGVCLKGDDCSFVHQLVPCKYFHRGLKCYSGNTCKFSHQPLTTQSREEFENENHSRLPSSSPNHENLIYSQNPSNGYVVDDKSDCSKKRSTSENFQPQETFVPQQSPFDSSLPSRNFNPAPNQFVRSDSEPPAIRGPMDFRSHSFPPVNQFYPPINGAFPFPPPFHMFPPIAGIPMPRGPFPQFAASMGDTPLQQKFDQNTRENNLDRNDSERDPRCKSESSDLSNQSSSTTNSKSRLKIETSNMVASSKPNSAPNTPSIPQVRPPRKIPLETDAANLYSLSDPRKFKHYLDGSGYKCPNTRNIPSSRLLLPSLPGIAMPDGPLIKCIKLTAWKPLVEIDFKLIDYSEGNESSQLIAKIDTKGIPMPKILNDFLPEIPVELNLENDVHDASKDSLDQNDVSKSENLSQYNYSPHISDNFTAQSSLNMFSNGESSKTDFSKTSSIKDLFKQVDPTASPFL